MIPLQVQCLSVSVLLEVVGVSMALLTKRYRQTDVLLTTCLSEPSRYCQGVIKQRGQSVLVLTPWSAPIQQRRSSLCSWQLCWSLRRQVWAIHGGSQQEYATVIRWNEMLTLVIRRTGGCPTRQSSLCSLTISGGFQDNIMSNLMWVRYWIWTRDFLWSPPAWLAQCFSDNGP